MFTIKELLDWVAHNPEQPMPFAVYSHGSWRGDGSVPCLYVDFNKNSQAQDMQLHLENLLEGEYAGYKGTEHSYELDNTVMLEEDSQACEGDWDAWPKDHYGLIELEIQIKRDLMQIKKDNRRVTDNG